MNKFELITALADEANISKRAASHTVDILLGIILKKISNEEKVQLTGFGTFKVTKRPARKGRNPRTGEILQIPAALVPKFLPGAFFRSVVNEEK